MGQCWSNKYNTLINKYMKEIDLNFELVDMHGKVISTAGKLVCGFLMSELKGDAEKLYDWAIKLNLGEKLSIDNADFNTLKTLIKTTERLSVMVKGPIIKYFETIK